MSLQSMEFQRELIQKRREAEEGSLQKTRFLAAVSHDVRTPANAISLLQLLGMIERLQGRAPAVRYEGWRPGDQRYYVSNTSAFANAASWSPKVPAARGIERLYAWLAERHSPRRGGAHA